MSINSQYIKAGGSQIPIYLQGLVLDQTVAETAEATLPTEPAETVTQTVTVTVT